MEMQNFEFSQLVFGLALFQYFPTTLHFQHFGMVRDILCHYMLEVCSPLFHSDFIGLTFRRELELWNSKQVVTVIKMETFKVGFNEFLHYDMATSIWGQGSGM